MKYFHFRVVRIRKIIDCGPAKFDKESKWDIVTS
jgi:hypothetical protein